jgi:hypothetical protein
VSYGRGSRDTALRIARALTERPISASSAAAWTAVPSTSAPVEGTGLRVRGVVGVPAGWAGWRSGVGFGRGDADGRGRSGWAEEAFGVRLAFAAFARR